MQTVNEAWFRCRPQRAFQLAAAVERWPELLPHYRWVRVQSPAVASTSAEQVVEMAARRDFGRLNWPVWWLSRMWQDPDAYLIRYLHIAGVTRGMEVEWRFTPAYTGTRVAVHHRWDGGPRFCGPVSRPVGRHIVGPLFVQHIADQTLHHLACHVREGRIG